MGKNFLSVLGEIAGVLSQPRDEMNARITDSGRKVVTISKDNGNSKYSVTQYPNGTTVETKTSKKR